MAVDWALGGFTIQSNTAYTKMSYQEQCDCDFTGANIFFATLDESYDQFSQEFRLISPSSDRLNYIAGAYFGRVVEVNSDVWSVFGQLTYDFSDQFSVQLGARYTDDSKDGSRLGRVINVDGGALPAAQAGAPLVYARNACC